MYVHVTTNYDYEPHSYVVTTNSFVETNLNTLHVRS